APRARCPRTATRVDGDARARAPTPGRDAAPGPGRGSTPVEVAIAMTQVTPLIEEAAEGVSSDKLKRICVHVSPKNLADARLLSQVLAGPGGKRLTTAAVLRLAQERGLELLQGEQQSMGH